jgi:hypothetical protein
MLAKQARGQIPASPRLPRGCEMPSHPKIRRNRQPVRECQVIGGASADEDAGHGEPNPVPRR